MEKFHSPLLVRIANSLGGQGGGSCNTAESVVKLGMAQGEKICCVSYN